MTITYTWTINSLETRDEGDYTDAVVQTRWTKTGTDEEGNSGSFNGATPFTAANVPPGEFIPFDQLTEEIVLGWIKAVVSDDPDEHVNQQIRQQIDRAKSPIVPRPLPWVPAE